jgi:hypothetical protein
MVLLLYLFCGLTESAIHAGFHIRHFELENFAWFRELRAIHLMHHQHKKNYSIVNILPDIFFGSLYL